MSSTTTLVPYLLPPWGYALLLGLYGTFVISTTIHFVLLRSNPSIHHRCPILTTLGALANLLLFAWALLRHTDFKNSPCIAQMWLISIGFPLCIVALGSRLLHMVSVLASTKQLGTIHFKSSMSGMNKSAMPASTGFSSDAPWTEKWDGNANNSASLHSAEHTSFWYRYRRFFSDGRLALVAGVFVLAHAILALVLQLTNEYPTKANETEADGRTYKYCRDYLPQNVLVFCYIVILIPVPMYRLFQMKERYHMFGSLVMGLTTIVIAAVILTVVFGSTASSEQITQMWWVSLVYAIFIVISHIILVCYPIFIVYWRVRLGWVTKSHPANSREAFEELLEDPVRLASFLAFASNVLCGENVLFCIRVRQASMIADEDERADELRDIFNMFIRVNAQHELNLSYQTRRALIGEFMSDNRATLRYSMHRPLKRVTDPNVFRDAYNEVVTLMYQHTYPRYLEWLENGES